LYQDLRSFQPPLAVMRVAQKMNIISGLKITRVGLPLEHIRRIAPALGKRMSRTLPTLFVSLDQAVDARKVCESYCVRTGYDSIF